MSEKKRRIREYFPPSATEALGIPETTFRRQLKEIESNSQGLSAENSFLDLFSGDEVSVD